MPLLLLVMRLLLVERAVVREGNCRAWRKAFRGADGALCEWCSGPLDTERDNRENHFSTNGAEGVERFGCSWVLSPFEFRLVLQAFGDRVQAQAADNENDNHRHLRPNKTETLRKQPT